MISFSEEELAKQPSVEVGQEIDCPHCGGKHVLFGSSPPDDFFPLLFYKCNYAIYIGGVDGRQVNMGPIYTGTQQSEEEFAKRYSDFLEGDAEWYEKERLFV